MAVMQVHKLAAALRKRRPARTRTYPCTVLRVDPLLLAVALDMADNDASRIQILDSETVLVRNRSRRESS